jgi:hypothetical protein
LAGKIKIKNNSITDALPSARHHGKLINLTNAGCKWKIMFAIQIPNFN